MGAILIAAVWAFAYRSIVVEREQTYSRSAEQAKHLAGFFEQNVLQIFRYGDTYLKLVRREYLQNGSLDAVREIIADLPLRRSIVSHIAVIDETGTPIFNSDYAVKPGGTVQDQGYFKFQKANQGDRIFVSLPKKRQDSGKITLRLARRIDKPDGGFGGVIFAAIDVKQITAFFTALNLGPNSSAMLVGMDKRIRARTSYGRRGPGQDISGSKIWRELARNPVGLYKQRSVVDDVTRHYAYRRLAEFPLVAAIGVALKDISATVTAAQIPTYEIALLITLVIVIVTAVLCRNILWARNDVDERIKAEQRFNHFVGATSDFLWEMDEDLRFSYLSSQYITVTGVPETMLLGKTLEEVEISGISPEVRIQQLDDLAAHRPFRNFIYPRTMPDGGVIHLSINGVPVFNDANDFTGYRGTGADVTERVAMEDALRRAHDKLERRVEERTRELGRSEARFRAVVDNSPAAIVLKDTQGRYLIVNKMHRKWLNAETRDYLGKTVHDMMPGTYADEIAAHENLVIQDGVQSEKERHAMFPDGIVRTTWAHKFPIFGPDGDCTGIGSITFDVTEQRNIESQLRQAQKMEAVGQLTGGIAHDFNNLLAIVIGNLDYLAEGLQDNADLLTLTEAATNAALKGAALNRQLLAFSRKQNLSPKVIDLNVHLSGMFDMLRRTLGQTVQIEAKQKAGPLTANVDPGQLQSAVLNLAVNAGDAMPDGGMLSFETRKVRIDDEYAAARTEVTAGEYVMLAVSDTGTGMPPDVLAQVFEPFFTTKEIGEGSGLGLSMVFGFTQQSGGHVEIESTVGQGTTVTLYLPYTPL